jgi:hypothetical protein
MANFPRLGLPLLQAAQAQKHVTVNEALVLLDGLTQLSFISVTIQTPPALASDGDCYALPIGSVNDWQGRDSDIAIYSNGGWIFATPQTGWKAWDQEITAQVVFDGSNWVAGVVAMSQNGAAFAFSVVEIEHTIGVGATSIVPLALPASTVVHAITGRVTVPMSGSLTGWRLGIGGSDNRYGSGLGLTVGSWVRGLTSSPQTYYSATDLLLTSEGADFVDGQVRLAIHISSFGLPNL